MQWEAASPSQCLKMILEVLPDKILQRVVSPWLSGIHFWLLAGGVCRWVTSPCNLNVKFLLGWDCPLSSNFKIFFGVTHWAKTRFSGVEGALIYCIILPYGEGGMGTDGFPGARGDFKPVVPGKEFGSRACQDPSANIRTCMWRKQHKFEQKRSLVTTLQRLGLLTGSRNAFIIILLDLVF